MNTLGIALIYCMIQVTIFALAAGVVYLAVSRRDSATAARTAFGSMLGIAIITAMFWSPWPNWSGIVQWSLKSQHERSESEQGAGSDPSKSFADAVRTEGHLNTPRFAATSWSDKIRSIWDGLQQVGAVDELAGQRAIRSKWQAAVSFAIVGAAALGLSRLICGLLAVRNLRRNSAPLEDLQLREMACALSADLGCTRKFTLMECTQLAGPATVGWRSPLVLLPGNWRDWNPAEKRSVLAHEIAHVGRGDFATHFVAQFGLALHFYHPLVHWLARRLRLEQEFAADAAAARVAGGRHSYLTTLAGLALAQPSIKLTWPVRAFLPTRCTFMRRIEMLRDRNGIETQRGTSRTRMFTGWLTIAVLCSAGAAAVGLRAPAPAHAQEPPASTTPTAELATTAPNNRVPYDFSYVPDNFIFLAAVRPAQLAADARLRPLANLWEENTRPGIPSKLVEQTTVLFVAPELNEQGRIRSRGGEQIVIHATEPIDFATYLKKGYPTLTTAQDGGHEFMVISPSPSTMSFATPDKQTLVGSVRSELVNLLSDAKAAQPPANAETWKSTAKGPLFVVAQSAPSRIFFDGRTDPVAALLLPLLDAADTLLLRVEPGENLKIHGRFVCKSPESAKLVAETVEALAVFARNAVDSQRKHAAEDSATRQDFEALWQLVHECVAGRKITTNGNNVQIELSAGNTDAAVKLIVDTLAPAIRASRAAAHRNTSLNNLKQIGLAMHNYEAMHRRMPPATLLGPDGKTPYSWRVELLPLLGYEALYKQYHFDQPWDSPDNRKVLEQIPVIYRHPADSEQSTNASYFVMTGPDTVFPDGEGTAVAEIKDGLSKTLLVVEAKREIPWTKPEDLPYAADQPAPELGGWVPNLANVAYCDGRALPMKKDGVSEKDLRALITKAGGETIELEW